MRINRRFLFAISGALVFVAPAGEVALAAQNSTEVSRFDVGAHARVVHWSPSQTEGTQAARGEEFPAKDVYPYRELSPTPEGLYRLEVDDQGMGCVGLRWDEERFLRTLILELAAPGPLPETGPIKVQFWTGDSSWQGKWQDLPVEPTREGNRWQWILPDGSLPAGGTTKIRWLVPGAGSQAAAKRPLAYSRTPWQTAEVRIQAEAAATSTPVPIEIYNGQILAGADGNSPWRRTWNRQAPVTLKVRYSEPQQIKHDRTVLRFAFPGTAFGVAVEDVLEHGSIYIPHAGLFVTRMPAPETLNAHRARIAGQTTTLEEVRELPDQTFAQALEKVHQPIQNFGPMLLSLGPDNRKFTVHRDGVINFHVTAAADEYYPHIMLNDTVDKWYAGARNGYPTETIPVRYNQDLLENPQLRPRFGEGTHGEDELVRHLDGSWIPIPVSTLRQNGLVYRQRTCVAPVDDTAPKGAADWLRHRAVCVAEYTVENTGTTTAEAALSVTLYENAKAQQLAELEPQDRGAVAVIDGRVLALADTTQAGPLKTSIDSGTVTVAGQLPAGQTARLCVYLPAWNLGPENLDALDSNTPWAEKTKAYWKDLFAPAMQIELPDSVLADVIRASQVHCMLVARNEAAGTRVGPWIAADRYGTLACESQAIIRGMDMLGQTGFARSGLEYFRVRYNDAGFLAPVGFTLIGTGENLWTLAEHYDRTGDRAWLESSADEVARVCNWVLQQREKTRRWDPGGRPVPESGMAPPGNSADWKRYAFRFFNDTQYATGLREAGRVLKEIDHPSGEAIQREAARYADDTRRAYLWSQGRAPVIQLGNGTWVPGYPALLFGCGLIEDFFSGEDTNRSWCYDVELGAHHLAVNGIIDPRSDQAGWMADHMEDYQFLRTGMGAYPEEENLQDVFNRGGFAKMQPYYSRNAELSALRDDVKPFIRSYLNALASLLNQEVLFLWEHFGNYLAWNKTHETGWFLAQSRLMFVQERGDQLWLAPFVTNHWLQDGMQVAVRQAPTRFGQVAYTIKSSVDNGYIDAQIQPPRRAPPQQIVIRLRHPEEKPIRSVTVGGQPHQDFEPETSIVRVKPESGTIDVRVSY
jgi:hypothetical protein